MKFNSYTEFYNSIKTIDLNQCPTLNFFIAAVNNINVGCGCTKKSRIKQVNERYYTLAEELTDHEKTILKEKFGPEVEFASSNILHGKI